MTAPRGCDVAVVGGGIVGLAHAWMAARRGLRVVLLERNSVASGASVRNFGMIWPVGQPAGPPLATALRSRELWLELQAAGAVHVERCGSLHLARQPDELAVLEEFCQQETHAVRMLRPQEIVRLSSLANPDGLLGGMHSEAELRVDPRLASKSIAAWLQSTGQAECCFETPVTRIDGDVVCAADGRRFAAGRIVICSGSDLRTLYGEVLRRSGLRLCKLQMLGAAPQAELPANSPHIASGLTLRHYAAFEDCPSLPALKDRIASETPELDRFGIHVMASPMPDGRVVLGDSHEYGDDISPFDKAEIDQLMLRELRKVVRLQDWTIAERWHGVYAKHPTAPVFQCEAAENVHVFVGTGGAGMTMSMGLADRAWQDWTGEQQS